MKTLRTTMMAILALVAVSCNVDDVQDRPVVAAGTAPVLTAPEEGNVYVLKEENADALAERFIWTAADFGEGIIPNYDIEIDSTGQNFDTPVVIGTALGTTQLAVTTSILNNALTTLGAIPEQSGTFQVRVKAHVGDLIIYSDPVEMLITPYQGIIPLQQLYIFGSATEFGDNNNAGNTPLFRDPANQFLFTLTAYFNAGDLKMTANRGTSAPQYGSSADGVLAIGESVSPIVIATSGYYTVTVNISELTYTVEAFDASASPSYTTIGILGSATPTEWTSDTNLANTTGNTHIWHLDAFTFLTVTDGAAKFREGDDWVNSWGATTPLSGQGQNAGDPNIPVITGGTYNIWFNDLDGRYLFIPVN